MHTGNNLHGMGAKALVPALQALTGLKSLNLEDNNLTKDDKSDLKEKLQGIEKLVI